MRTPTFATRSSGRPRPAARRRARGFTLVELLVVFAILALLVGLVPIAFGKLREAAQYRDSVRGMLTEMRNARTRAVRTGTEVRFIVDADARGYGVEGFTLRRLPEPLALRAIVANRELGPDRRAAIRFLPGGGATGGSVDIVRPSGAGVRLRVDWLFGHVEQEGIGP